MHDETFPAALARRFDAHEERLRRVALRMTGSETEAADALAVVRAGLGRDDGAPVRAWLTALVARECLRARRGRRATEGRGPGAGRGDGGGGGGGGGGKSAGLVAGGSGGAGKDASGGRGPGSSGGRGASAGGGPGSSGDRGASAGAGESGDRGASVWLALFLVLETLGAEERLAYVLHDVFGLPSYETARITGGSPEEVARLARGARERVRGHGAARTEGAAARQRAVVDLFLAAARARDARTLAAVLDPDVVAHSEHGPVHGAPAVAEGAASFARFADVARPALVDGAVGAVAFLDGRPVSAVAFALRGDRIVTVSVTTGEARVRALDLVFSDG
ncbi:RNA polymerase sigma-70 factor (ECF subfamily) [Streptomyces sp. PvR006]|uniref:sigma factor n=1 Tax=Streptomyces sp. PvR006 TaxID=2817860 RepID=UPI001AE9E64F|nr:sigma factor [Streptomyces sp. PvR006]MBP2580960.1 RNA polymerase sigma-70 factor (ECF subfamily) [Streptomyces sp. PvR006]